MGRDKVVADSHKISDYFSHDYVADSHKISDYFSHDYVADRPQATLVVLKDKLIDAGRSEGYILAELDVGREQYLGKMSLLKFVELERDGVSMAKPCDAHFVHESGVQAQCVLTADTTIGAAMQQVQYFVGESIAVVDREDNIFLGVVQVDAIVKAYMDVLHRVRWEEHGAD